jgi:hypothetical protein
LRAIDISNDGGDQHPSSEANDTPITRRALQSLRCAHMLRPVESRHVFDRHDHATPGPSRPHIPEPGDHLSHSTRKTSDRRATGLRHGVPRPLSRCAPHDLKDPSCPR